MWTLRKNNYIFILKRTFVISIFLFVTFFLNSLTSAQIVKVTRNDTTSLSIVDTARHSTTDSASSTYPISSDKLESAVHYQAIDSIVYDAKLKRLLLYSGAVISYEEIKVTSDFIAYDQDSSTLSAHKDTTIINEDTTHHENRIAQGSESSTFSDLKYNFKSKRALVENAYSQYGDGFILSEQVKRNNDNTINGYKNLYTTCNAVHPHFGIAARRVKIIPNKVAVTGSANLVVEDVPTPLYLPFGLFPLKQGQRSGFKLPTYDMSENLGFGLREGGYYFAVSEHVDLLVLADIYALGTWRTNIISNYSYRYRFNGGLNFNFGYNKIGESFEAGNQSFRTYHLSWNHSINPNIIPGSNFMAHVDIGSSKYNTYNTYDMATHLNNTFSSTISYSKSWTGKPFNFSAALRTNQNTGTGFVNITLPEINFSATQLFPFQFRKDIIKPRWYEKIGASYTFSAVNNLSFTDSLFDINKLRFEDFQNGMKHSLPITANYNILKYVNLSFGASYNEYWYTKKYFKQYNFNELKLDTTMNTGFFTARDFGVSSSMSTRIYGIKLFKHGAIKGIRHVLTPSIGFSYRPDFGSSPFQYYYNSFTDSNYTNSRLNYFEGNPFNVYPPDGKSGGINFSLGNTLQMKIRSKKDTISGTRKVNLIDGLDMSTFYNIAADSNKWSNLALSYRTTLFENIRLSGDMNYSFYAINKQNGRRIAAFEYAETGKLLRFQSAGIAVSAELPVRKNKSALSKADDKQKLAIGKNYDSYVDFNIPWSLRLNYSVRFSKVYLIAAQKDTITKSQDINFTSDVTLTPKWKIGLSSGYNFDDKKLTYTSFNIYRDLHCWEMKLNLIPFGFLRSYNFTLNVKSAVLQDLKLVRRKDFRDFL